MKNIYPMVHFRQPELSLVQWGMHLKRITSLLHLSTKKSMSEKVTELMLTSHPTLGQVAISSGKKMMGWKSFHEEQNISQKQV